MFPLEKPADDSGETVAGRLDILSSRPAGTEHGSEDVLLSVCSTFLILLAAPRALVFDGLEFKERETLAQYVAVKRNLGIATFASMATLAPALVLLLISYVSPSTTSPYLYLVFLAVSIPFSILSFKANSKLTEIINSNDVRHVRFS